MIASLLYTSTAAANIDSGDVFAIIEASARRNPSRGVTGFLIYDGREFLQYVEGPQDALDTLLSQLAEDRRHGGVRILQRAESPTRLFPKWAMRRAGQGAEEELAVISRTALPSAMMAELERFGSRRKAA